MLVLWYGQIEPSPPIRAATAKPDPSVLRSTARLAETASAGCRSAKT